MKAQTVKNHPEEHKNRKDVITEEVESADERRSVEKKRRTGETCDLQVHNKETPRDFLKKKTSQEKQTRKELGAPEDLRSPATS